MLKQIVNQTIPTFLDRRDGEPWAAPKVRQTSKSKTTWKRTKSKPPKSKDYRGAHRMTLMLKDQASSIGSGRRVVWVKVAIKWVYLADDYGNRSKVLVSTFQHILKGAS